MKYLKPSAGISRAELEELENRLSVFYKQPPSAYHAGAASGNEDWSDPAHELHRRIAARVFSGAEILDVGCGPAMSVPHFAAAGAAYTGLDISSARIEENRLRHPGAAFISGDWRDLRGLGRVFDLVASFFVLEHMVRPREFLAASASAVKPGGLLAVLCPDYLRRGFMPSQHFFGSEAGGLREKIRKLAFLEVLRTAADKYLFYPLLLRRARQAAHSGGAWVINLRPVCLETDAWASDWDAVYMAGEAEIAAYIGGLGFEILERGEDMKDVKHGFCYVLGRKSLK